MLLEITLPFNEMKSILFFIGLSVIGYLLLHITNVAIILLGFTFLLVALHEFGHILALKKRGYQVTGIKLTVLGPGVIPDRPISLEDSTLVYFSGLISLFVPFLTLIFDPNNWAAFSLIAFFAVTLCAADILNWWQIQQESHARGCS